jgi:negative regulator of flagellin synthesis FlgM
MTIERLGPVDPIQNYNKTEKVNKPKAKPEGDSISVSDEARLRAEVMQAIEDAKNVSDIRHDRVAEVKQKLEDPSYIDERVVDMVADEIISVFDIG